MIEVHMDVAASMVRAPVSIGAAYNVVGGQPYEGEYEVTPTTTPITLQTKNRYLTENMIINPIPSNYGLITQVGSYIRVS